MKMKKLITAVAITTSAILMSGCMQTSSPYEIHTLAEMFQADSALTRARVLKVVPQHINEEIIDLYDGDLAEFQKLYPDENFESFTNKKIIYLYTHKEMGASIQDFVLVDKNINISDDDIIDYKSASRNLEQLAYRSGGGKHPIISYSVGHYSVKLINSKYFELIKPAVFLDVVCEANEAGCSVNSSKETRIGVIRRIESINEYRGAKNEFVPEENEFDLSFANELGFCDGCKDDDEKFREWMRQEGYIE